MKNLWKCNGRVQGIILYFLIRANKLIFYYFSSIITVNKTLYERRSSTMSNLCETILNTQEGYDKMVYLRMKLL